MAVSYGAHVSAYVSNALSVTSTAVSTTTGSTIVLFLWGDNGPTYTPSDNGGHTWTAIGSAVTDSAGSVCRAYYCANITGSASHTFTTTTNSNASQGVWMVEVLGAATSGALDTYSSADDTSSPFTAGSGFTNAQADEMLVSFIGSDTTSTFNPSESTGFTRADARNGSATLWGGASYYKVLSAVAANNPSYTASGTSAGVVFLVGIKGAAGGGGTTYTETSDDGIAVTEGTQRFLLRGRGVAEVLAMSDAASRFMLRTAQTSEGIALGDTTTDSAMRNRFVSDTADLTDGGVYFRVHGRVGSDAVTVADGAVQSAIRNRWTDDGFSATDQVLSSLLRQRYASDIVTVIDSLVYSILGTVIYFKTVTENFSLTDELVYGVDRRRWMDDGFDPGDGSIKHLRLMRASSDDVTLIDAIISAIIGSGTIFTSVSSDSVRLVDDLLHTAERNRISADALSFTDATIATVQRLRMLAEDITFSDGALTFRILGRRLDELLQIEDGYLSTFYPAVMFDVHVALGRDRGAMLGGYTPFRVGGRSIIVLGGYA